MLEVIASKTCMIPKTFILDVDGVLTTGSFLYDETGKCYKIFGPDDNDGLKLLKDKIKIIFITGDKRGFQISKKRIVDDMGYELFLVSTIQRIKWIRERYNPLEVIYMGDGIFDHLVMKNVGYGIAPQNADELTKKSAQFITKRSGGDRAVAEASIHVLNKFFSKYKLEEVLNNNSSQIPEEWIG